MLLYLCLPGLGQNKSQHKTGKKGEPLTEAGKGIQKDQIHKLILRLHPTNSQLYPYVLLKDGTIYSRMDVSPSDLDVKLSKKTAPEKWGTWQKTGTSYQVHFHNGRKQTWGTWHPTRPASESETIDGVYKCVGSFGGSRVHNSNTLILRDDGTFTWRYFYRSKGIFKPHKNDKAIKGSYRLEHYTIHFEYENGEVERLLFAIFEEQGGFTIGVKPFAEMTELQIDP
ncbi:MAG: hypothetical protein OER04_13695 [Cyclobacteriaceae bacterium]|nr:hypothetical protein [Cyclobacteriaceae bacterium]